MLELNKIYNIHCVDGLKQLDDESINCIVTSPPYWNLRDYQTKDLIWDDNSNCEHEWISFIRKGQWRGGGFVEKLSRKGVNNFQEFPDIEQNYCNKCGAWKGSLGNEPEFDLYIKHLCDIFDDVKRVLKKDGTCWIVLGDTYNSTPIGKQVDLKRKIASGGFSYEYKKNISDKFPMKCLLQIPSRFTIEMTNRCWILRNCIIWHKPNAMPSPVKDRFTVDFKYLYFFVKNKKYYFKQQLEPYETKLNEYKNKRCVWSINTKSLEDLHFATFPPELIDIPIKSGCPENGIVLDPFIGSGTVGIVAKNQKKNYIGFELNPEYVQIAEKRIRENIKEYNHSILDLF